MPQFSGQIEFSGSTDLYNVSLLSGVQYYFELEGSPTGAGSLPDAFLRLLRNGSQIAVDDDGGVGVNSRIVFTPTQSGTYQLEASGLGSDTGTYRLRAFADDFRNSVEGIGPFGLAPTGSSGAGRLDYSGDADIFGVALVSGLTYTIEQRGASSGSGTLSNTFLYRLDGSDNVEASDNDSGAGLDSLLTFKATTSGVHFFQARAFQDNKVGTYTMVVSEGLGTAGNDSIVGLGINDAINGLGGSDTILGANGSDRLIGDVGNDNLRGQNGADLIRGGVGGDILIGGTANDIFDFDFASESAPGLRDTIRAGDGAPAFERVGLSGGDRIDLSGIDADAIAGGNQTFIFGGAGRGHVSLVNVGTNTIVRANTDNDAAFEFELVIEDAVVAATAYTTGEFLL